MQDYPGVFYIRSALNQRRGKDIIKLNYLVKTSVFFKECPHSFPGASSFAGIVFDILYFQYFEEKSTTEYQLL